MVGGQGGQAVPLKGSLALGLIWNPDTWDARGTFLSLDCGVMVLL